MIAGIDLAGPANHKDTSIAVIDNFHISVESGLSDTDIYNMVISKGLRHIGFDAPLSYSETGGFRESDRELRKLLNSHGYTQIGIMAPTYSRMIYLTGRGIRLSRLLSCLEKKPCLYEVHPGAYLVLENFPYELVKNIKQSHSDVAELVNRIESRGYVFNNFPKSDHELMAVAAALAVEAKLSGDNHWEFKDDTLDGYPFIA